MRGSVGMKVARNAGNITALRERLRNEYTSHRHRDILYENKSLTSAVSRFQKKITEENTKKRMTNLRRQEKCLDAASNRAFR